MSASSFALLLRVTALAAAFSPVLVGLRQSLAEDPGQRGILLTPLLIASLLLHGAPPDRRSEPAPRPGLALIALGIGLELIGLATEASVVARVGLPVALVGLALLSGRPDPRIAIFAFGLVPFPDFVKTATSPLAESRLAGALAFVGASLGASIEARGPLLLARDQVLELVPGDVGYTTALLLAEWGAYRALRSGGDLAKLSLGALRGALSTAIAQPLLGATAMGLLVLGFPLLARSWLHHGVAVGLAVFVLATHFAPRRSGAAAWPPAPGASR